MANYAVIHHTKPCRPLRSVSTRISPALYGSEYLFYSAQMGRGIALLFHDRGTRRGWVFSSTPLPHFTSGKEPVPIVQEAGWAPGPVWTGGKSRPHRDLIPDRSARSQSLYRLNYPAHEYLFYSAQMVCIRKRFVLLVQPLILMIK